MRKATTAPAEMPTIKAILGELEFSSLLLAVEPAPSAVTSLSLALEPEGWASDGGSEAEERVTDEADWDPTGSAGSRVIIGIGAADRDAGISETSETVVELLLDADTGGGRLVLEVVGLGVEETDVLVGSGGFEVVGSGAGLPLKMSCECHKLKEVLTGQRKRKAEGH